MTFSVITGEIRDGSVSIAPRGEVDFSNAFLLREAVDAVLVDRKPRSIVIDLSDVRLIDSVGIGVMVHCYHAAAASRVSLVAVSPSSTVYRQLWVAGLAGLFGLATPRAERESAVA